MDRIFIKNLKSVRQFYGITQRELAEEIPFLKEIGRDGHKTYSKMERGERKISISEAIELARYFKVSLDLMCFTDFPEYQKSAKGMTAEEREAVIGTWSHRFGNG